MARFEPLARAQGGPWLLMLGQPAVQASFRLSALWARRSSLERRAAPGVAWVAAGAIWGQGAIQMAEPIQHAHDAARRELELAEAELAVLKQELVLQHLVDTGEPTAEARRVLSRLRDVATQLSESPSDTDADLTGEAA